jgi:hypothetical protein
MSVHQNAVSIQINEHARFITFALRGVVYGADLLDATERAFAGLAEPWGYNRLYDLRAFINVLQPEDFVALAEQWPKLAGRRASMRWAILTDDPVRLARAKAYGPLFPDITVRTFDTLADAISWLSDDLTADQAAA